MKSFCPILIAFILSLFLVSAGCIQSPGGKAAGTPVPAPAATLAQVTPGTVPQLPPPGTITSADLDAFVTAARAYALANGKEKALAAFNDPHGPWVQGDVYIFAEGYDGTALAEPLQHELIGTNIRDMTDRFGVPVVRNLEETAQYGMGYVSYDYPNPKQNSTAEPKLSVVADVDGTYYVGAGMYAGSGMVYPSVVLNPSAKVNTVQDLRAFVKSAVAYARENGKEKAIAAFNDPKGQFVQGELVVMAFDRNGTNLAAPPYSPELVKYHINLINYHDPDGFGTIRAMRDLSESGGGTVYTVTRASLGGKDVYIPKIDYAEPVDGSWWLFSGITDPGSAQIRTGNMTGIMIRNYTRMELYDLVNRAAGYAQANGNEKTLAAINDPKGPFVNGDLFAWAESSDGTILADPFWKAGIGNNYLNYTDLYGAETTRVALDALRNGTGFNHEMFPDTVRNGTAAIPKLVYMKAVDDTWWIGSGIYGIQVG